MYVHICARTYVRTYVCIEDTLKILMYDSNTEHLSVEDTLLILLHMYVTVSQTHTSVLRT